MTRTLVAARFGFTWPLVLGTAFVAIACDGGDPKTPPPPRGAGEGGEGGEAGSDGARGGSAGSARGGTAGSNRGGSAGRGGEAGEPPSSGGTSEAGTSGAGRGGSGGTSGGAGTNSGGAGTNSGGAGPGGEGGLAEGGAAAQTSGGEGGDAGGEPIVVPPSCRGMTGTECQGGDCCESPLVPGGTFEQGEPTTFTSTVSDFRLDKFEVTVGRFRRFVAAYDDWRAAGNPMAGAGAYPWVDGSGWPASDSAFLPADAAALVASVTRSLIPSWTQALDDSSPINSVDWYVAFAFCIFDGGRLPTDSEFEYASVGGDEDRVYPWGDTPVADGSATYAVESCVGDGVPGCTSSDYLPVGSRPLGVGRWGHMDLSGLLFEWIRDSVVNYPVGPTVNYLALTDGVWQVLRSGDFDTFAVQGWVRWNADKNDWGNDLGVRCARDP